MSERWMNLLPQARSRPNETRVHMDSPDAADVICRALVDSSYGLVRSADGIVLLCVGTDRSIGDALGPLVGTYVEQRNPVGFSVLGTLEKPVHAGNLVETVGWVNKNYRRPLVIAVDACLGRTESIGMLTVAPGSLLPGAGVNKTLPPVGDVHVTGVVNVGGFMEYFVLQNTRLSLVMRMAGVAAAGIFQGLQRLSMRRRPSC